MTAAEALDGLCTAIKCGDPEVALRRANAVAAVCREWVRESTLPLRRPEPGTCPNHGWIVDYPRFRRQRRCTCPICQREDAKLDQAERDLVHALRDSRRSVAVAITKEWLAWHGEL